MSTRKDQLLRRAAGKKGRAAALTREEKSLRTFLEQAAQGHAQPDLSQNDPDAADYVKNRTHYVEKAFDDIAWDGDTEGREGYETPYGMSMYKVSDKVPTIGDLLGATLHRYDGEVIEIDADELVQKSEEVIGCHYPNAVIVSAPTTFAGFTYPSAGVYFPITPIGHTHSLKAKETVHKIDPKYLPDDIGGGEKYDLVIFKDGPYITIEQGSFEAAKAKLLAVEEVRVKTYATDSEYKCTRYFPVLRVMYNEETDTIEILVLANTGELETCYVRR